MKFTTNVCVLTSATFQHHLIDQAGNADSVQCYVIRCFIIIIINNKIYTLVKFVGQMNAILSWWIEVIITYSIYNSTEKATGGMVTW